MTWYTVLRFLITFYVYIGAHTAWKASTAMYREEHKDCWNWKHNAEAVLVVFAWGLLALGIIGPRSRE